MYCPKCGKVLANNAIFCRYCGKNLRQNEVVTGWGAGAGSSASAPAGVGANPYPRPSPGYSPVIQQDKKSKAPLIIAIVTLVLVIGILGGIFALKHFQKEPIIGEWALTDLLGENGESFLELYPEEAREFVEVRSLFFYDDGTLYAIDKQDEEEEWGTWINITEKSEKSPHYRLDMPSLHTDFYIQNKKMYIDDGYGRTFVWEKK